MKMYKLTEPNFLARKLTAENMQEVSTWCGGTMSHSYLTLVWINVIEFTSNDNTFEVFVGDYVVKFLGKNKTHFFVYTEDQFLDLFVYYEIL